MGDNSAVCPNRPNRLGLTAQPGMQKQRRQRRRLQTGQRKGLGNLGMPSILAVAGAPIKGAAFPYTANGLNAQPP